MSSPSSRGSVPEQTLRRICSEYIEMPGLQLTLKQAQRLWGLDEQTCMRSLDYLVDVEFLIRGDDHVYRRMNDGVVKSPLLRMAKASLLERRPAGRASA